MTTTDTTAARKRDIERTAWSCLNNAGTRDEQAARVVAALSTLTAERDAAQASMKDQAAYYKACVHERDKAQRDLSAVRARLEEAVRLLRVWRRHPTVTDTISDFTDAFLAQHATPAEPATGETKR